MSIQGFRNDESGYRSWIEANPGGYVINILRGLNANTARLHQATCWTIDPRRPGPWTGEYVKICSPKLDELDDWATEQTGAPIARCGTCWPKARSNTARARGAARAPETTAASERTTPRRPLCTSPGRRAATEIRGPLPRSPVVEAWCDDYIRFERRPVEQEKLRDEIRTRLRRLKPKPDEVLHATFLGTKHPAADVENLVLYYIDDSGGVFASAARFGLRFELGARTPVSPSGKDYSYGYRYGLVPRSAGFRHWCPGRQLAAWDWLELGGLSGPKKLEQVWLAMARTAVDVASPVRSVETPFALRLVLRPPRGKPALVAALVKGLLDGIVCAFQAQTDRTNISELANRISKTVVRHPDEIEALLLNQEKAVLGSVPRLVHLRGEGVIWAPADDLCVACELIVESRASVSTWQMKGEILEVASCESGAGSSL